MHMQMVDSFRIPLSLLAGYIPALATIVTTVFSVVLARATLRQVEATDRSLELAREEFEREWSPDLHIKMERVSATEARLIVTNLAKTSVLMQLLQLRKLSHAMPFERCRLNDPLVGGMTWTLEMGKRIVACTGSEFEGPIAAAMTFYAAGRMYRTDWFRSQIHVRDGRIVSLEPSNMPTRRVRQIERKNKPERRREFVQDVTADIPPEQVNTQPDESFFTAGAGE
jgi:cell division protein FtsL